MTFRRLLPLLAALAPSLVPAAPNLVCDAPLHDMGVMLSTQVVSHTFHLRNAGDAPARITRVHSSCGCTSVMPHRDTVPPGETEPLEVRFDAKGRHGPQNRLVYLSWNSTNNLPLRLSLTGLVYNVIEREPTSVRFDQVAPTGALERVVRFYDPTGRTPFRITGVTIPHACFSYRLETVREGHDYRLVLVCPGPRKGGGMAVTAATVTTDNPDFVAFRIPITLCVAGGPPGAAPPIRIAPARGVTPRLLPPNDEAESATGETD